MVVVVVLGVVAVEEASIEREGGRRVAVDVSKIEKRC